jgi:hypothetical protein
MLFLVHQYGMLEPVTETTRPAPQPGDTAVLLGLTAQ